MATTRRRALRSLTGAERRALLRAVASILLVRFVLWRMPLATALRLVRAMSSWRAARAARPPVALIAWSVEATASRLPRTTCLPRALATQLLMAWHGYRSVLRIGLRRDRRGPAAGHAWVEFRGRVLIGALADLACYQPLPPLPLRALPALLGFYALAESARLRLAAGAALLAPIAAPQEPRP